VATQRLEIMTAEKELYSEDVDLVVAPGAIGQLGILPHHAPLLTLLQPGELMVRKNGEDEYIAVTGGFLEVMANRIVVLADAVERAEEIDEQRALEAMKRAQERIDSRTSDLDLQRALASMRRAQARLKVARRRRRREGRSRPPDMSG
jgi:F-type H+-transporting ATPase subunit epsilon